MSKNIVDSVLEMESPILGLLPTRRQIDFCDGYVNNWNTEEFYNYVRSKSNIILERDHFGINQGECEIEKSIVEDSKYFNIIHLDPWKHKPFFEDGLYETIKNIKIISEQNRNIKFEIGTEEAIRHFDVKELVELLYELKVELTEFDYNKIEYVCIQSGVGLDLVNKKNIGRFNIDLLRKMVEVCKTFGKKSKEHNGDYLSKQEIIIRFENGLDTLNIGPEIAQLETQVYLDYMTTNEIDKFYNICLKSEKWKKWVQPNFDLNDKENLISVCGHYNYHHLDMHDIDDIVKETIKNKLKELISYV
jgi:hypothetical protein